MKRFFINFTAVLCFIIFAALISSFLLHVITPPQALGKLSKRSEAITGEENIQVNVLNTTETKGIAGKTRDFLIQNGFDVVDIGNLDKTCKQSYVIDRIGDSVSARKAAETLGLPDSMIVRKVDSSLSLRASIVLGEDFKNLKLFKEKNITNGKIR